jgi:CDGSH-type Zn-finger protein/uncharacterized Fe-S cluster protein YjdI
VTLETPIHAKTREELLYLLAEAAEIEHNLMCCYLFAAFSLKSQDDGLSEDQLKAVRAWRSEIISIAVEEMTHLALVANLTLALGGAPHFGRPNFPIASGYHPSGVIVELHPFNASTLDHFIFLERPEGMNLPDGEAYLKLSKSYVRQMEGDRLMPSGQDYETVGHLYRGIRSAIEALCHQNGEETMFIGPKALQVGPDLAPLPGLIAVTDRASALKACDIIVDQGEGSQIDHSRSHFNRFMAIRDRYQDLIKADPEFKPARAVAHNPVMRRGPELTGKTFVDEPEAARVMDLSNALYNLMMRALAQGYSETDPKAKNHFIEVAIQGMYALTPVAEHLTRLKASTQDAQCTAGMSFATIRDITPLPDTSAALKFIAERLEQLAQGAKTTINDDKLAQSTQSALMRLSNSLLSLIPEKTLAMTEKSVDPYDSQKGQSPAIEVAEGRDLIIEFEAKRCIHSRACVLQQPGTFKANVVGPWIAPDDATSTEGLIATAQNCPSGSIQYRRKDGGLEEQAPPVNLIQVRENGPLGFRAPLTIDDQDHGYRATLCRCGRSNNKPFCDGTHKEGDNPFMATGEPDVGDVAPLEVRDGALRIMPQTNGPLQINGNIEMISGTGKTFRKAQSVRLCRCGHSANKPFCDGSHVSTGFIS